MKFDLEMVGVWGLAVVLVLIAAMLVSGCQTAECSNSGTAEFPTVERWWK